jgi:hypothetical protein
VVRTPMPPWPEFLFGALLVLVLSFVTGMWSR